MAIRLTLFLVSAFDINYYKQYDVDWLALLINLNGKGWSSYFFMKVSLTLVIGTASLQHIGSWTIRQNETFSQWMFWKRGKLSSIDWCVMIPPSQCAIAKLSLSSNSFKAIPLITGHTSRFVDISITPISDVRLHQYNFEGLEFLETKRFFSTIPLTFYGDNISHLIAN